MISLSVIFSPIQTAIAAFCKQVVLARTKLDESDFTRVVTWVQLAEGIADLKTGEERAQHVAELIATRYGDKVPAKLVVTVVMFVYHYAKKKGIVS